MGNEQQQLTTLLSEELRDRLSMVRHLEDTLRCLLEKARSTWPKISLAPEAFVPHVCEKVAGNENPQQAMENVQESDLYFACACANGDRQALSAFAEHYRPTIDKALKRIELPREQLDELKQQLELELLVGTGKGPLIGRYAGRGPLGGWLYVMAIRRARQLISKEKEIPGCDDQMLEELPAEYDDPEVQYLKKHFKKEFSMAFREALESLTDRERVLLRLQVIGGHDPAEIAAVYHVHRTTVARWLTAARHSLLTGTRQALMLRLDIDQAQHDSIMRLIRSQLEIDLHSALREEDERG
jgi:RNA polymerase sigma-70 factor (ECF subfamily)